MTHPLIFNILQRNYLTIRHKKREASKPPQVIPLGFEPKTHALEGRCSNPTELRNRPFSECKGSTFIVNCKIS